MANIAVFEPYYGGSHRAFVDGLVRAVPHRFQVHTLSANRWKWRMRLAAPFFAGQIAQGEICLDGVEAILCSSLLDVAAFKGLLPRACQSLPIHTYFHENQFAYPVRQPDPRDIHFALTNLTTALSSDSLAFNSRYNLDSFLDGCRALLAKNNDMGLGDIAAVIRAKSRILPPALAPQEISPAPAVSLGGPPVIVWNHRWEHDKDPDFFFATLLALQTEGVPFRLVVLGESFRQQPPVFAQARKILAERVLHFGYARSRTEYLAWLGRGDIVVSTARHEFFGLAVLEAVAAGCRPLLPRRLVYPELFAPEFLYDDAEFEDRLRALLLGPPQERAQMAELVIPYTWPRQALAFAAWLEGGEG